MSREKEGYRNTLEWLIEENKKVNGDVQMLNKCEVAKLLGIHRSTAARRYKFNQHGELPLPELARQICV